MFETTPAGGEDGVCDYIPLLASDEDLARYPRKPWPQIKKVLGLLTPFFANKF